MAPVAPMAFSVLVSRRGQVTETDLCCQSEVAGSRQAPRRGRIRPTMAFSARHRVSHGVGDLVRLRACLASEVKVLVRHTHSGL